ncbi:DUF3883 domain-containing protein [Oceanicola sp. 502str15]|uniref:DUF3883 domain-containing protein n=1 Tax=Oceanicola sp. 502str15 TaxID=2696061 RepID=UPI002094DCD3|nr:DUF3883 domain-containing protein [Oceanicola sp. 502str15]MCO6383064.1 DUF3883 domain-containing protein [Oceanicola sp. 502str15]
MAEGPWTDQENDAIVADYFDMLADDLCGRAYNKAAHNRGLQAETGRSRGSIEFKHCNISAALLGFAQPIIRGYLPRYNIQDSLKEAIDRWLIKNPEWAERLPRTPHAAGMAEPRPLFAGVPPTLRNAPPSEEDEQLRAIARHFDVAARDERNRALGKAGEELALEHERGNLRRAGRADLAKQVVWTSHEEGDGAGYDIASFTPEGRPRLLEVKTTNGPDRTPFYISQNEISVANARRYEWHLFRLYNFAREPELFELRPPLEHHVTLTATSFRAGFD